MKCFFNTKFNHDISNWNVDNVTDIQNMFWNNSNQPFWFINDTLLRNNAIEKYKNMLLLHEKLETNLMPTKNLSKKSKI